MRTLLFAALFTGIAHGTPVRVGSKAFTESIVLAEVLVDLVRREGAEAVHRRSLGGSPILWRALKSGDIDAYVEYSGTLVGELLPELRGADAAEVAKRLAALGLGASRTLGFEDKYALGMPKALAKRLGIRTLGDLKAHPALRYALTHEFMDRREGWPAVRAAYGLAPKNVRGVQHVIAYQGVASGVVDVTDLYTTDAEIASLGLVALEDDRHVFPEYAAFVLYRLEAAKRSPALADVLEKLPGAVDEASMIAMNARVKLEKVSEEKVARDFVASRWGASKTAETTKDRGARIWQRTKEHLFLVAVAMLATILVALPLGVVAARSAWLGAALLGVAGVLQTIPSLALLVFLIPLLGIGEAPALVALFLYGLLPVMRNTALGLHSIPPGLDESARALGLSPWARLRRVELPLASPAIVAGLKTATTLAVGTATLGALIGAGGYGQPILEGLRRDELSRTLEGAVPAALLALAVQAVFAGLERWVVPRGLRLRPARESA